MNDCMKNNNNKAEKASADYFVHPSSYVDDGAVIGRGTRVWHFSHIMPGAVIGENCTLGQNVNVNRNVRIGNYVKIQNNVSVYEGVELEDYVFCGPSMVFTNIPFPRCEFPQRGSEFYRKTLVKRGASIGANATVVCGHTIGRCAFIGAGSVVTRDVAPYQVVAGVPARPIRPRFPEGTSRALMKTEWWNWDHETLQERFDDFLDLDTFLEKYT